MPIHYLWILGVLCGCVSEKKAEPEQLRSTAAQVAPADPPKVLSESQVSKFRFDDLAKKLGVDFVYRNGEEAELFSIVESLGGGVGMLDFDQDGRIDLLFPGGGTFTNEKTMPALANGLFWNRGEQFVSTASVAKIQQVTNYTHGVEVGDFDNDGFPDVLISGYDELTLFQNQGDGTFRTCSNWNDVQSLLWLTSLAFGDFTSDGNLDIYAARYVNWTFANNPICKSSQDGPRDICPPKSFAPLPDLLLISDGQGSFQDASASFGLLPDGKGLGVLCADFDNDQDLDVYVANDTTNNFLYLNQQGKSFTEVGLRHGAAVDEKGLPNGSMGIAAADYDHDGWLDLWVTNYEREAFALYRNSGDAQFTHFSRRMGTTAIGGSYVGFGTHLGDLDADGSPEIVVADGHVVHHPTAAPYRQLPLLLSLVDGRFRREEFAADNYFGSSHLGRGLAIGDLNGDGMQDIVISHLNEPVAVLINAMTPVNDSLRLRLIGTACSRDAIGARVVIESGNEQRSYQVIGGGSYLSRSERIITHPLSKSTTELTITVYWPNTSEPQVLTVRSEIRQMTIIEPHRAN